MTKQTITVKETISLVDRIDMTNLMVAYQFSTDSDGTETYTPYYRVIGELIGFIDNFVEGITFEKDEDRFEVVSADVELMIAHQMFCEDNTQYKEIVTDVNAMVEFKKAQMLQSQKPINIEVTTISKFDDAIVKFAETLEKIVTELPKNFNTKSIQPFMDKINAISNPDMEDVVKAIVKENKKGRFLDHLKPKKKVKTDVVNDSSNITEVK